MEKEQITIQSLASRQQIMVDYSDDDVVIIDNIKKLSEPNTARIKMNLIAFAKKGKVQAVLGNDVVTLAENQLLLCPPNSVFTDFMFSPDFDFGAVFLSNRIIQSFLREKISVWNEVMYIHKRHVVTLEERDMDFMFHFYSLLRLMIDAPVNVYTYRSECIQGLLRCAVLGLCGVLRSKMPQIGESRLTQGVNLFQQFLDLLGGEGSKYRKVEDYASELCISPKYLSVVCKKASGKTANEWIREHVLEDIRYYLKQTDLPMKQIASRLGFANPSFFGKYVKDHFGMTPMQFRVR